MRFLSQHGARVFLSDAGKTRKALPPNVTAEWGQHSDRLLAMDLIIRSPGVSNALPVIKKAKAKAIPLWSELELGSRFIKPSPLIAITGTNGKTTTTTLVGEIFKAYRPKTQVGGNIGTPLTALVKKVAPRTPVVCEVSSYQLEDIQTFHPHVSAILNITPDHLEHHGSMKAYAEAKARIFENQSKEDVCVLNWDDPQCRRLAKTAPSRVFWFSRREVLRQGVSLVGRDVKIAWSGWSRRWPLVWSLPGPHNLENALAAIAIATAAEVPEAVIRKTLAAFKGVEHRLEIVRDLGGVRYINDSKGTNVDSTRVALASFSEPLIVIMGGEGKGAPYTPLIPLLKKNVRQLLLIGEDAPTIRKALGSFVPTEELGTLPRAVRRARALANPGDVVLLSPACASFDQYNNYEERGRHFKTLVRALR